jgi:hypothetical protein
MDAIRTLKERLLSVVHPKPTVQSTQCESTSALPAVAMPSLVAHADWSTHATKRWMTCAIRINEG